MKAGDALSGMHTGQQMGLHGGFADEVIYPLGEGLFQILIFFLGCEQDYIGEHVFTPIEFPHQLSQF